MVLFHSRCLVVAIAALCFARAHADNSTSLDTTDVDAQQPGVVIASPLLAASDTFTWQLNTATSRSFKGVSKDPGDPRASSHGSSTISVSTNGILTMAGSTPRYYVTAPSAVFQDVEMVAYGRLTKKKAKFKDLAGMTMVTRSNHGTFEQDPCSAMGYYSRIYFNTGEFAFQKEFYHSKQDGETIYTASRRQKLFNGGFPVNKWIGMKYEIRTNADGKSVNLKGYVDDENESGNWKLVFETTDSGGWKASKQVPTTCGFKDDEIVLRGGQNSYFRTDDVDGFEWKKMAIRVL